MRNTVRIGLAVLLLAAIATLSQAQITSAATGNWSATGTWVGGVVPGASDNVVIANGHTVTLNTNAAAASITVGQGVSGVLTFSNAVSDTLSVTGNITVAAGASFIVPAQILTTGSTTSASTVITGVASTAGLAVGMNISGTGIPAGSKITAFDASTITISLAATVTGTGVAIAAGYDNALVLGGNLVNNGTFDLSYGYGAGVCNTTLNNKTGDQSISGAGTTTRFRLVTLDKSAVANKVNASINVAVSTITFTAGTWEQSAGRLTTTSTVQVGTAAATTALNIIASGSAAIGGNLNVYGSLLVNTTDSLLVGSGASKIDLTNVVGAVATFTNGTVAVLGKMAIASVSNVTINGANIFIDPKGFTATDYAFRYTTGTGGVSPLTFTSGTVTIMNPNPTSGANPELAMSSSVAMVSSGDATFILGQGAGTTASTAGFRINLNTTNKLNNLTVNTGSVGVTLSAALTVNGTLTVTSCGTLGGAFTWTASRYVFNGSVAQVTGTIMPATAKYLEVNNPAGVTSSQALALDTLRLVSGTLSGPFTATVTLSGGTDVPVDGVVIPQEFSMSQNYPNPFNPSTVVRYQVPGVSMVDLRVFDLLGREVAVLVNGVRNAGTYDVSFDASSLPSGVYLARIAAGTFTATKRMVLTK